MLHYVTTDLIYLFQGNYKEILARQVYRSFVIMYLSGCKTVVHLEEAKAIRGVLKLT